FRLNGELWLEEPGDTIRVHFPDGRVEPLTCGRGCKGPLLVALSLDLPVGVSYVWLESEMGGAHLGSGGKEPGGAFAARLPFRLEQEGSAGRP
ncbi:MAG TPA: hypothetical protein VKI41_01275, partial [Vicinamibacteria bacterium]|nr:hypothetical protein [Vicinamibacteria bacterium]